MFAFISSRDCSNKMSKSVCYFDCNVTEIVKSDTFPFSKNSEMDDKPPDHAIITGKECVFENIEDQTHSNAVLDRSLQKSEKCGIDLNEERNQQPIDNISKSVTEINEKDDRPKISRKRSSSLTSLILLKQALGATGDDQYERIKLRRVSSIPCTYSSGSAGEDTQLEDGLLTTTLCSTEL